MNNLQNGLRKIKISLLDFRNAPHAVGQLLLPASYFGWANDGSSNVQTGAKSAMKQEDSISNG
jgi:hypothetical protein